MSLLYLLILFQNTEVDNPVNVLFLFLNPEVAKPVDIIFDSEPEVDNSFNLFFFVSEN